jgi:hypothetical protein
VLSVTGGGLADAKGALCGHLCRSFSMRWRIGADAYHLDWAR